VPRRKQEAGTCPTALDSRIASLAASATELGAQVLRQTRCRRSGVDGLSCRRRRFNRPPLPAGAVGEPTNSSSARRNPSETARRASAEVDSVQRSVDWLDMAWLQLRTEPWPL